MTLRARLLLSATILSLATTVALALVVRKSWQDAEAERFRAEFEQAVASLEEKLHGVGPNLGETLAPFCEHDPIVDSALVGLKSGSLQSRLLSLRARVPELAKALGVEELYLVTSEGDVIAGDKLPFDFSREQTRSWAEEVSDTPRFSSSGAPAFEAGCRKEEGHDWIALIAVQHVDSLLEQAGKAAGLNLSLHDQTNAMQFDSSLMHVEELRVAALEGAVLRAVRSRKSLHANLARLDAQVLSAALATLAGALVLAVLLSRGLAKPVVNFAERTRQAVQGRVEELPISGGPELEQAARAFNATLADLASLRERLEVTERIAARREVARQLAHEIKNPLSPIRTSVETLRKMKEQQHEDFDSYFSETTAAILQEVKKISTLVSHFAEYANVPSPSKTKTNLLPLVKQAIGLHQNMGAEISLEHDGAFDIDVDEEQISQVLTNLLKNALEATASLDQPRIFVSLSHENESIHVTVTDNGPGLSKMAAEKIFEPYMTTKRSGTGLGLAISHRIAVEHGGDLTYTTPETGGARFTLRLPTHGPELFGPKTGILSR